MQGSKKPKNINLRKNKRPLNSFSSTKLTAYLFRDAEIHGIWTTSDSLACTTKFPGIFTHFIFHSSVTYCSLKIELRTKALLKTKNMGEGEKESMEIWEIKLWNYLIKQKK